MLLDGLVYMVAEYSRAEGLFKPVNEYEGKSEKRLLDWLTDKTKKERKRLVVFEIEFSMNGSSIEHGRWNADVWYIYTAKKYA